LWRYATPACVLIPALALLTWAGPTTGALLIGAATAAALVGAMTYSRGTGHDVLRRVAGVGRALTLAGAPAPIGPAPHD
jgi:hypothetical protein